MKHSALGVFCAESSFEYTTFDPTEGLRRHIKMLARLLFNREQLTKALLAFMHSPSNGSPERTS